MGANRARPSCVRQEIEPIPWEVRGCGIEAQAKPQALREHVVRGPAVILAPVSVQ